MFSYPSQYEAEAALELWEAIDQSFVGYCRDSEVAKLRSKFLEDLRGRFQEIFNSPEKSPWEIKIKRNKQVIQWRENWEAPSEG